MDTVIATITVLNTNARMTFVRMILHAARDAIRPGTATAIVATMIAKVR